jgi:hypothetical protein
MRLKSILTVVTAFYLFFVAFGDKVFPSPLSDASLSTRNAINRALIGIFPEKEIKSPHQRTEDAVRELEQKR